MARHLQGCGGERCRNRGHPAPLSLKQWRQFMGRGILLWLLGIPIPIIILLALFWH